LLRSIDEQEEKRERARCHRGQVERQRRCVVDELSEAGRAGLTPTARSAATPQSVDELERRSSFEALYHASKCISETSYILV
jgi:hypothetical protein